MAMRVHELHPTLIHAPLTLLPAATGVEVLAAVRESRSLSRLGYRLWQLTVGGGLLAGLAGMAASQEVRVRDKQTTDMMFLHGLGNVGMVVAAFGLALRRRRRRATVGTATVALMATGLAVYTGWLGGQLVYSHAVGVKAAVPGIERGVAPQTPPLFSKQAPRRLLHDAIAGAAWLFTTAGRAASGRERIERGAIRGEGPETMEAVATTH